MQQKVKSLPKLIAIVGPTASGKSALAIELARRYGGEVVSCDSRQVYRGLDIGSGKVTKREMRGVPHHLLDVANPRRTFTAAQYQRLTQKTIKDIWRRNRLPILCGGTGFYLSSVLNGTALPAVKPNAALRHRLEKKSTTALFRLLSTKDPSRARAIDPRNRRRLIRALEIASALGRVPKPTTHGLPAHVLIIGIKKSRPQLQRLIKTRLTKRLRQGLLGEVRRLHAHGLSWRRLESFGLEYRAVTRYLQGSTTRSEMQQSILRESWQYARRQMTWFRRLPEVKWIKKPAPAAVTVGNFLTTLTR